MTKQEPCRSIALAGLISAMIVALAGAAHADRRAPMPPAPVALMPLEDHLSSKARAINAHGEVAGFSFDGHPLATIWDHRGRPWPLAPLEGDSGSEAFAINRRGALAGDSEDGAEIPTLWAARAGPTVLPLPAGSEGIAFALNHRDAAGVSIDGLLHTAVLWRRGVPVSLAALPGDEESWAWGINGRGDVVGFSAGEAGTTAVLWPAFGKPQHGKQQMAHQGRFGR